MDRMKSYWIYTETSPTNPEAPLFYAKKRVSYKKKREGFFKASKPNRALPLISTLQKGYSRIKPTILVDRFRLSRRFRSRIEPTA